MVWAVDLAGSRAQFLEFDQDTGTDDDFARAQVGEPIPGLAIAGGGIGATAHAASR